MAITEQYKKALLKLEEILKVEKSEIVRDSAIQRFEFTFDLAWKAIKVFLEENKGIICRSPKDCLREAYQQGIIKYDDFWMEMVDLRNETAHTYKEETADKVYVLLPKIIEKFQELSVGLGK